MPIRPVRMTPVSSGNRGTIWTYRNLVAARGAISEWHDTWNWSAVIAERQVSRARPLNPANRARLHRLLVSAS